MLAPLTCVLRFAHSASDMVAKVQTAQVALHTANCSNPTAAASCTLTSASHLADHVTKAASAQNDSLQHQTLRECF